MKKGIVLSTFTLGLLSSVSLNAADGLGSMFSEGKTSGQIREFSISRSVEYTDSTKDYTRDANAIGGHLKFESGAYKGLSFASAFYTTNGFALGNTKTDYKVVDPTLLGKDNNSYSLFGEAYIKYNMKDTVLVGGRQKVKNPMVSSDDARMLPNLVEEYSLKHKGIANTTLSIAHTTKFAQGTFGRAYGGGILSATAGYSVVDSKDQVGKFVNMGTYAVGKSTAGVTSVSAVYTGIKGLKVQLWDFYAHDIMNTIYADASYKVKLDSFSPFVAAQFIKQTDVGDKLLKNTAISTNGELDSMYYALKAGVSVNNFTAYAAYSKTSANSTSDKTNEGSATNSIISMWGGMPGYTQGMVTRHHNLAGTKAMKLAAVYNWKAHGPNLKTVVYYANYDMDANNGYTSGDAKEAGFDIIYNTSFLKNLQLRLRGNYADDFNVNATGDTVGWSEYRFIANYNF